MTVDECIMTGAGLQRTARWLSIAAGMLLVACSASTTSGMNEGPRSGVKSGSGNDLVMQVRAAGELGNELDVQPLRDPQVEDLRARASLAESRGDYAAAQRALTGALQLSPDDPGLLQWQAEIALASRDWAHADQWARQSYAKGPQLGGLCRRNWATIRFAAQARRDAAAAAEAQQRGTACKVAPPIRM